MRKLFVSLCIIATALLPSQLQAQKNENANHEDSYYLKGAVPEVNGKVVFSKEFSIAGMSQAEVYAKTQEWMDARMKQNNNKSRVAYTNEEKGQIAANGEEYIVFSNAGLALDRTKVMYQMTAECDDGKCVLQIKNIRYDYPNEKEIYVAEDWITDEYALTKDQTRLARGYAKWRRKTVDFVDDMNESLQQALSGVAIASTDSKPEETRKADAVAIVETKPVVETPVTETKVVTPVEETKPVITPVETKPVVTPVVAAPVVESKPVEVPVVETKAVETPVVETKVAETPVVTTPVVEKPVKTKPAAPAEMFPELTADKILASNGRLVIIIGDDEFNRTTMTADAGGYLSTRNGKKYINTILTPNQNYQSLARAEEYMVAFYPNGSKEPSVVMKCKNATTEKPAPGRANIFVGEITSVESH